MAGLIVRMAAYLALVVALVIEFKGYDYPNLSGSLFMGGVVTLLVLALSRAFRTRGKLKDRNEDE